MNGNDQLINALKKLNIDIVSLVAETSVWASPTVCEQLISETGSSTRFPNVRRKRIEETRGEFVNGIKMDDNTYANNAIKNAIGVRRQDISDFQTCHIFPNTCYDERYHTCIPNLVLIPNAIAQLSDNFEDVIKALQYRSYELYNWYPEGFSQPIKPENYPTNWQEPISPKEKISKNTLKKQENEVSFEDTKELYIDRESTEIEKVLRKVPIWIEKADQQINSIILISFLDLLQDNEFVSRKQLKEECASRVNDFDGNFSQMAQFGQKNHGKVFEVVKDEVRLWEPVSEFIKNLYKIHQLELSNK